MTDIARTEPAPNSARRRMVEAAVGLVLGNPPAAPSAPTKRRRATRADARGAEAVGIRAVAEAAGVTHAAPLHHFPDRVSLLAAVAAEGQRRLASALETAQRDSATGNARELLLAVVSAQALWAARNPGLWDVMVNPQLTADVNSVWEARREGKPAEDALAAGTSVAADRNRVRRATAFDELVDAKLRVFEAYNAAVQACRADQLRSERLPGGDRRPLVHALTTVADGLSLQFVGEHAVNEPALRQHVQRTLDLLLAGVLRV